MLKERGLDGVKLIVGDKCLGMLESVVEVLPEAKYQRCRLTQFALPVIVRVLMDPDRFTVCMDGNTFFSTLMDQLCPMLQTKFGCDFPCIHTILSDSS